jgi:lantibiotic modifying enzyme
MIKLPRLFQDNKPEDYLTAAIETANWIDTFAIKTEHGRIWENFPSDQEGYTKDAPFFTEKCLYSGSSGIGLFFIRLYECTKDERWLKEACEAADHIIATEVGPEWYEETLTSEVGGIIPVPGWAAGVFNGPTGEALFVEDLYAHTGKQEYRDFVLRTADNLILAAKTDEKGLHWSNEEDIVGDGGHVVFLDLIYRKTKIQKYLDVACQAADYIAKDALDAPTEGKFWKLLDLSLIDFEKDTTFPNWSHGTAGTSWMFAALYQDTQNPLYLELAKAGLEYVKSIAVGDENGTLIPYQNHPVTGPTYDKYYLSTCHGPAGTTLAFRLLYEITGDEEYNDWTINLSRGIIRAGAPEKHSWGYWNVQCQCCGTSGILEHFAEMYDHTQSEEFLGYLKRTADVMLSDSDHRVEDQRTWYDCWWRTIPQRVVSYTGLYVGAAGCASSLLRTYAAMTGKKLTNIIEYKFFDK